MLGKSSESRIEPGFFSAAQSALRLDGPTRLRRGPSRGPLCLTPAALVRGENGPAQEVIRGLPRNPRSNVLTLDGRAADRLSENVFVSATPELRA